MLLEFIIRFPSKKFDLSSIIEAFSKNSTVKSVAESIKNGEKNGGPMGRNAAVRIEKRAGLWYHNEKEIRE